MRHARLRGYMTLCLLRYHTLLTYSWSVGRIYYKVATSSTDCSRSLISEYSKAHNFRENDNWVANWTDSNPPQYRRSRSNLFATQHSCFRLLQVTFRLLQYPSITLREFGCSDSKVGWLMRRQAAGLQDTLLVALSHTFDLSLLLVGWTHINILQSSYQQY